MLYVTYICVSLDFDLNNHMWTHVMGGCKFTPLCMN